MSRHRACLGCTPKDSEFHVKTPLLNYKFQIFKTKNRKQNQVAQKSARNETETGIPVSATSWFRQEDFGFVCSLRQGFPGHSISGPKKHQNTKYKGNGHNLTHYFVLAIHNVYFEQIVVYNNFCPMHNFQLCFYELSMFVQIFAITVILAIFTNLAIITTNNYSQIYGQISKKSF